MENLRKRMRHQLMQPQNLRELSEYREAILLHSNFEGKGKQLACLVLTHGTVKLFKIQMLLLTGGKFKFLG